MIRQGIDFFPAIIAEKTGFDGFRNQPAETDMLAPQVDVCIKKYLPEIAASPYAAVYILVGSLAMVYGGKYMDYRQWLKAKSEKVVQS